MGCSIEKFDVTEATLQTFTFFNEEGRRNNFEFVLYDLYRSKSTGIRIHGKTMSNCIFTKFEYSVIFHCSRNESVKSSKNRIEKTRFWIG